jgi:thiol-disulfide isomerase/thioredoxin
LVVAVIGAWQTRDHVAPGTVVTGVTLHSLDGGSSLLSSFRGKPTAVAFWAPWCPVCKAESGNLSWLAKLVGDRAQVVSVAAAYDSVQDVRTYMADQQVDYQVLLGNDEVVRAFRVEAFPTVYFLDPEGRVKGSVSGYTTTLGLLARLLL